MSEPLLSTLRAALINLIAGTIFLFIGSIACAIAAIRRRQGARAFLWIGIWSMVYGLLQLTQNGILLPLSPRWLLKIAPTLNTTLTYSTVVAGSLAFRELSKGKLRQLILIFALLGLLIAVMGVAFFVWTGAPDRMIPSNNALAACLLAVLAAAVAVPKLARQYMMADRGVLVVGTLLFTAEALCVNLLRPLGLGTPVILDHIGFAILLFSFGYSALQLVVVNEHRLLAVENELAIAREIQASILPASLPAIDQLRISAVYRPMTAVAGDFYEFVPIDRNRLGILVADVSGHGVPAALIASMIKVGMQSVISCSQDPSAVLRSLNRILSGQLRGQFVSAAYLWIDTAAHSILYSAAGHPPLLLWRDGRLERIESNGLLLGVFPERIDFPVASIPIYPGDRFLLYTDGISEPENVRGEPFGDNRLEDVIRRNQSATPSQLADRVISGIESWLPSANPPDDQTLIVVDVGEVKDLSTSDGDCTPQPVAVEEFAIRNPARSR